MNELELKDCVIPCGALLVRLGSLKASLEDLNKQKEENAKKQNWKVVNAIKDTIVLLSKSEKLIEDILEDAEER